MRNDSQRLDDMQVAIAKIEALLPSSEETFQNDEMLQVWVIHHLQVIGEAARGVSATPRERFPEVPWPQIIALRNILVHEYFGLNLHQVWIMARTDLPVLKKQIEDIRRTL
jgi:uncharacterized protein with HEPN domain